MSVMSVIVILTPQIIDGSMSVYYFGGVDPPNNLRRSIIWGV